MINPTHTVLLRNH